MRSTITTVLAVALAIGMLASLATPAAAQGSPGLLPLVGDLGPLIELLVELFDIDIRIAG
jgi:hypothetical protein